MVAANKEKEVHDARLRVKRPNNFWSPFSTWWRQHHDATGRRATTAEIREWYYLHAHIIWPAEQLPEIDELLKLSKGMRTLQQVKEYFRSYRRACKSRKIGYGSSCAACLGSQGGSEATQYQQQVCMCEECCRSHLGICELPYPPIDESANACGGQSARVLSSVMSNEACTTPQPHQQRYRYEEQQQESEQHPELYQPYHHPALPHLLQQPRQQVMQETSMTPPRHQERQEGYWKPAALWYDATAPSTAPPCYGYPPAYPPYHAMYQAPYGYEYFLAQPMDGTSQLVAVYHGPVPPYPEAEYGVRPVWPTAASPAVRAAPDPAVTSTPPPPPSGWRRVASTVPEGLPQSRYRGEPGGEEAGNFMAVGEEGLCLENLRRSLFKPEPAESGAGASPGQGPGRHVQTAEMKMEDFEDADLAADLYFILGGKEGVV
ncbi:hypothetical protein VOLCADRAFT_91351 [Volvox carteri f. nagariensis]|uniref:Uncharacterized protein n=1 Tax=Volvox carteri f. nagariensis TaxID=3068 RepID=D8TWU6_VOLCA|nr:uncharacterized protein VOLCADRAFT_91351 [Volvox carteri f. nagariensis]EFJ48110.1 hypothetical protein VOLCADRAFT_91351 [Volvox carteri f. nagariensis]|eukprot:XP_002950795.1 hypothetical protein VOLCADRAFT_91351 [Volvox carteri f. nagariensis]